MNPDPNSQYDRAEPVRASRRPNRAPSRALELLDKLLASDSATVEQLAAALMVSVKTIERYRAKRPAIPLERQMLLATYTIDFVPRYARLGHLLRGQIRATLAFAARATETHAAPRPSARW